MQEIEEKSVEKLEVDNLKSCFRWNLDSKTNLDTISVSLFVR
jgi:hypothetical protein